MDFYNKRQFTVVYATESGNALDAAERIVREGRRLHFRPRIANVDTYPAESLISEDIVIFVVSTTGSGVEPRSLTPLWTKLLRSDLEEDLFEDLHYAVFGLGDSAYEKFCWAAKKLDRRLQSLGAARLIDRGEGDDQHQFGLESALDPWIDSLYNVLLGLSPLPEGLETRPKHALATPRATLKFCSSHLAAADAPPPLHLVTVNTNDRITGPEWFQEVRHIVLDLEEAVNYRPGDVAVIFPRAEEGDVDAFLGVVGWSEIADQVAVTSVTQDDPWPSRYPLPHRTTVRELVTSQLDFNAVPKRSFFELIRHFTTDETEREKLEEFCTIEGQEDLFEYCQKMKRSIFEVLSDFTSVHVPIDYIFDLLPPLRPRQFSIASSSKLHRGQIHLCVAVVSYLTRLRKPRKGVCSNYMAGMRKGDYFHIDVLPGYLQMPDDPSIPVICIGPGTGIAPMRSLLQERIVQGSTENTLYFGCRSSVQDQHFGTEWRALEAEGKLHYAVACSRDGAVGEQRTYVQDLMKQDSKEIAHSLIRKGAYVYISGSSNQMPEAVKRVLQEAIQSTQLTFGVDIIRQLESQGRLFEECWS